MGCLAATCCSASALRADTSISPAATASKAAAVAQWEQAEQGRESLEAIAETSRTRVDYTQAMDRYRAIYHGKPGGAHAAAAVNAVAELLAEQGRLFHDAKSFEAAVGQYEFLRTQYPTSSLGVPALLTEGEIAQDDLGDAELAREKYTLLLKTHPKSEQAEEARAGLESLVQSSVASPQLPANAAARKTFAAGAKVSGASQPGKLNGGGGVVDSTADMPTHRDGSSDSVLDPALRDTTAKPGTAGISSLPAMAQTSGSVDTTRRDWTSETARREAEPVVVMDTAADSTELKRSAKPAVVTGIRHWSTATYTRVAIDLGDSVTYEAARVPNPDRIYFDLHGTKLAPELVGKSFTVTDDGFLKKVRAAQYSDDVTRVVLDVNDVTEYSAFLLPNPYRLIIDIHGGKAPGNREQATAGADAAPVEAPAPRVAATVKATTARPVPNSVATKSPGATIEVADLSDLPGKVEATSKPTSKPISAVVEAGDRNQGSGNRSNVAGTGAADSTSSDRTPVSGSSDSAAGVPYSAAAAGAIPPDGAKKPRKSRTKAAQSSSLVVADATPARAAVPTADGETSLVRALGLKIGRIVIDAGHGGHDSGTLGAGGIEEKDVVLDVALRLGKLLHDRLGAEIIYTRSDDTFVPLETRTAIANKAQADLFLSIHANSSSDASARGVETYYLNFTSDPTALDVAARENAVSDQSIHQLSDLVKKIALKDKIAESREFASDVEGSLYAGLAKGNVGLKDRGVKKAPFVVLIGANMPSILAEISFVTNPKDAAQLQQPEYRERVAESIYKGVARYEGGLSGTRVATERASVGQ